MANLKRALAVLTAAGLLLGANSGSQAAGSSQPGWQAGQPASPGFSRADSPPSEDIPATYELVAENDRFELYADPAALAFLVVDRRSGYVWHSVLDEVLDDDRLNKSWTAFANSGISIEYLDAKAVNKRVSITNSETSIDFQRLEDGFQAAATFSEYGITVTVRARLEESGVRVEVPFDGIRADNPEFRLGLLYVYPFFGAARADSIPGYMFIPDGSGSLIRFTETSKARNMFYGRYYGDDLGMLTELPFDPFLNRAFKLSIPVMGMVHGEKENAFLAIIEKGAAYGELQAHPSGVITNFNFLYNAFVYNESYFQATNRSGAGVTTLQEKPNQYDVQVLYRFLTGAESDYVGMARSYQDYLVKQGQLNQVSDPQSEIGLRLEFLGAEKEKVLLWHRPIPMTTVPQMGEILRDLGIGNTDVVYFGWQPLGASSMPPRSLRIDTRLGSPQQLRDLAEEITAGGGQLYLYLDPQAALLEEPGYSARNDLAMSITRSNLIGYNRMKVNYYLNYETLSRHYSPLSTDVFTSLPAGLALDGIGSMLYSDFKTNHFLSREQTITLYQGLLGSQGGPTAFYTPNDYMFGTMQAYYDIPLGNSGYTYVTDVVPFLQIVLAGYVPYYGPALNFSANVQEDLLRQVEYGAYPAYFLTHEVTARILNTYSNWIYTSSYSQWSDNIRETYGWMDALLGPVKGQAITARETLSPGIVGVTYANGMQIVVNYSGLPYTLDGLTVEPKDALVREVHP